MQSSDGSLKQMAWLPIGGAGDGEKVLHIKVQGRWVPYNSTPYAVTDHIMNPPLQHGRPSRGFATMQKLFKQGYELITTEAAMRSVARFMDCSEINEVG